MSDATFLITTQIDLASFEKQLDAMKMKIRKAQSEIDKGVTSKSSKDEAKEVGETNKELKKQEVIFGGINKKVDKTSDRLMSAQKQAVGFSSALKDVGRRVFIWGTLSAGIFGMITGLKGAITSTIELETAMAELKKVLPDTTDFEFLKGESFKLAAKYGADVIDTAKVLKRFAQAGLEAGKALEATDTALLAMNTAGLSVEESINAIIAANRIFNVSFSESATIIDKVQRLQADFAIDAKDLIAAITGIGPAITVLNGNIDDLFASIAALGEAARISGKEASNSLKRMFARIVSKEGVAALQDLGIMVYKTEDTFRAFRDIMGDIGTKWDTLSETQKANLAITLAQVRQYPKMVALMSNYDRAVLAIEKSEGAFGDATKANEYVMATYAKRLAKAKVGISEFANEFVSSGIMPVLNDFVIILGTLGRGLKSLGGGFVAFAAVGVVAALSFSKIRNTVLSLSTAFTIAGGKWKGFTKLMKHGSISALDVEGNIVQLASKAQMLGLALAALPVVIWGVTEAWKHFTKDAKESEARIKKLTDALKTFKKSFAGIDVKGIAQIESGEKFNYVLNTLIDLESQSLVTEDAVIALNNALSDTQVTSTLMIAKEELENMKNVLDKMGKVFRDVFTIPLKDLIAKELVGVEDEFRKVIKAVSGLKVDEKYTKNLTDTLIKGFSDFRVRKPLYKPADFTEAGGVKEAANIKEWEQYLKEKGRRAEEDRKDKENIKVLVGLLNDVNGLQIEYDKLVLNTGINLEANNKIIEERKKLEEEIGGKVKQGAKIIFDFVPKEDIVEKAAKELGVSLGEEFRIAIPRSDLQTLKEMHKEVGNVTLEFLKTQDAFKDVLKNLNVDELDAFIVRLGMFVSKSEKAEKAFRAAFDLNAFLRGIGDSSATILEGFKSSFDAIKSVSKISSDLSYNFDATAKSIKLVDKTINNLIKNVSKGSVKIAGLKTSIIAAKAALAESGEMDIDADVSVHLGIEGIEEIENKIKGLQTTLIQTEEGYKADKKILDEQLETLVKMKKELEGIAQMEKLRGSYGSSILDAEQSRLEMAKKINDIRNIKGSDTYLKANLLFLKDELELEKKRIDIKKDAGDISEAIANRLKTELDYKYYILQVDEKQKAVLEEIIKEEDKRNEKLEIYKNGIEGLIGTQERYFELLESGGKFWKSLSEPLKDIGSDLFDRQIKQLTDSIKKTETPGEEIKSSIDSIDFKSKFENPMVNGAVKAGEKLNNIIGNSFAEVEIPDKIFEGFRRGTEYFKNVFLDIIKRTFDQGKGTVGSVEIPTPVPMEENVGVIKPISKPLDKFSSRDYSGDMVCKLDNDVQTSMQEQIAKLLEYEKQTSANTDEISNKVGKEGAQGAELDKTDVKGFGDKIKDLGKNLAAIGITMGGQAIGASIAESRGKDTSGMQTLSSIGGMVGTVVGGPLGTAIGAGLGGVLGGALFGGDKEQEEQTEQLVQIKEYSRQMVDKLSPEIFNAPSTFSLPAGRGFGGGSSINITNNIVASGGNLSESDANNLGEQLDDAYIRSTKRYSYME